MQHLTIQDMMTMHYVPKLDRKLVLYGIFWMATIATSTIALAVLV